MARPLQFASLDGTTLYGESNEYQPRPNSLARRSVSIFSRRGTETPEPKPPFIAQAAMQTKQMSDKQRRWIKRRSAPAESSLGPRGTVLHRVPAAKTITMTALEEEMATSPNEEILSAIGGTPITPTKFEWPATPSQEEMDRLWNTKTVPLAQRTMSKRRKEAHARIGVWRKGVTHWDDDLLREQPACVGPSLQESTGFSPLRRVPTETLNTPRPPKPILTVVIPSSELLMDDTAIPTIVHPTPQRSVDSMAPPSVVSKFALRPPSFTREGSEDDNVSPLVSALDSPSPRSFTPPPSRPGAPIRANISSDSLSGVKRYRKSSSSTLGSSREADEDSDCSRESSATSFDIIASNTPPEGRKHKSLVYSPISPSEYSLSDENATTTPVNLDKSLITQPIPPHPTRAAPAPPISLAERRHLHQLPRKPVPSQSRSEMLPSLEQANSACESLLSEAVNGNAEGHQSVPVHRNSSVRSVLHPPERAPTIPRRSRKREWREACKPTRAVQLSLRTARRRKSDSHLERPVVVQDELRLLRRSPSATEICLVSDVARLLRTPIEALLPPAPRIVIEDDLMIDNDFEGPSNLVDMQSSPQVDASVADKAAEMVLLHILTSLNSTQDLFNAAQINKGMYRVFKANEKDVLRAITRNQSPPAWEFREWCLSSNQTARKGPDSYMSSSRQDTQVVEALKRLILERCQTVIRPETALALSTSTHPDAQRFTDAFWRIWCFCKIFGCGKGREEDVTGQLDWLKGGLLAHSQDLTATANVNLDFEMESILLNPPEYFGEGNHGGLSARQLYDMIEIWTCMQTLLEGFHGRTEQAWDNGIFDDCGIGPGDDETEEHLLEEWTAYLLTLGPQVVVEMADLASSTSSAGFALAKMNGWTRWTPPENDGSRSTFLKEPLSRLYEERVAAEAAKHLNPSEEEKREMSRKRVATLAAEIKLARQSSTYRRLPYIDMSNERPMSAFSRRNSTMSTNSVRTMASMSSMRRQPSAASRRNTTPVSPMRYNGPPNFSVPRPKSPPSTLWSPRKISPIIEDRVETFNRMSTQNLGTVVTDPTTERAVRRITDMGFCASQARRALRMSNVGNGFRVDRAVDMLLRAKV